MNILFVLCFPVYGIGSYISATSSPSLGYIISVLIPVSIIIFYLIDMIYHRKIKLRLNANYWWLLVFLISAVFSLYFSFSSGLPEMSFNVMIFKSLILIIPLHAFMVVNYYNKDYDQYYLVNNLFYGLTILLLINLIGFYGLGLSNETHHIEGRLNFPFLGGLYEGSNVLCIVNLLLLYYFKKYNNNVIILTLLAVYFLGTLALIFFINSRLGIIILLIVYALFFFKMVRRTKIIYLLSIFTVPILLSSGLLIYEVLKLPLFASILQRVDLIDVVTFNGRAFLWQNTFDWLFYDQTGIFFGNGYRGHYFINLVSDVAKMWNEKNEHNMHLHSASLEIMVNQGLFGILIFVFLGFAVFNYLQKSYRKNLADAPLFSVFIYMIFLLQVDSFMYLDSLGFFILSAIFSKVIITEYVAEGSAIKHQFQNTSS